MLITIIPHGVKVNISSLPSIFFIKIAIRKKQKLQQHLREIFHSEAY